MNGLLFLVDTRRKLNVYKTFRRRPGRFVNVLCPFNLLLVSTGFPNKIIFYWSMHIKQIEKSTMKIMIIKIIRVTIFLTWGEYAIKLKT